VHERAGFAADLNQASGSGTAAAAGTEPQAGPAEDGTPDTGDPGGGVMDLGDTRRAILDAVSHLVIEGGPGSGKTTIALLKAARTLETLDPERGPADDQAVRVRR